MSNWTGNNGTPASQTSTGTPVTNGNGQTGTHIGGGQVIVNK